MDGQIGDLLALFPFVVFFLSFGDLKVVDIGLFDEI